MGTAENRRKHIDCPLKGINILLQQMQRLSRLYRMYSIADVEGEYSRENQLNNVAEESFKAKTFAFFVPTLWHTRAHSTWHSFQE